MRIQVETRDREIWRRFWVDGQDHVHSFFTPWRQIGLVGDITQVGVAHCRFEATKEDLSMGILEEINAKLDKLLAVQGKGTSTKAAAKEEPEDAEDETEEEEAPPKTKRTRTNPKVATIAQVKLKLKEVLDGQGRPAAVKLLKQFDAEKVGDLEEEKFVDFIAACDKVLVGKKPAKDEEEDDLDLEE